MLGLKKHPDLGGSSWDAALLNEAYAVLSNPERRAAYDREWTARNIRRSASPDSNQRTAAAQIICPVCKAVLTSQPQPGDHCLTCGSPLQSESTAKNRQRYQRAMQRTKRDDKVIYRSSWPGEGREGGNG